MASPNLSELVTTTLRNRTKKLADNVSENVALLKRLNERGNVMPFDGGRTIIQELDYGENGTYTRYAGYQVLNITPQDVLTAAEFDIKQVAVSVSMSGLEQIQNSGRERVIDWLSARVTNAERSMMNGLSGDIYSNGTADGGLQVGGLQLLVADTPTSGVVGGIDRATWTFFQNVSYDATTDGGAPVSSANIQQYMNKVYNQLVRNTDAPDLIIADNNYFSAYEESLQAIQRITGETSGRLGFTSYRYKNADVILDGGIGGSCPTNHMYFLNTKYIHFRPYSGRNMEVLGDDRYSVNQDAFVRIVGWAGNMTLSGGKFQGVLKD